MKYILFLLLICCNNSTIQPRILIGPVINDGCEESCTNREKLGCLEPKLKDQCLPTCRKTYANNLFNPKCSAFATREQMYPLCNVRCYK